MHEIIHVLKEEEYASAVLLFREYAEWLDIDLGFQKFEDELLQLKSMYAAPLGGIILYRLHKKNVGCIAIRKLKDDIAELKRMYVQPAAQGKGAGSLMLEEAILLAKTLGYKKIRLDTLSSMKPAIALYLKYGFIQIPAYYHNPQATAVFFEKDIGL